MDTHEQSVDAYEAELRAKYTSKDREELAKKGQAMPDGSYPIADTEDLQNAIHAVGRGGASHDTIRKHIIARADALGASSQIPDNWNSDGSLKQENAADTQAELRADDDDDNDAPDDPCPTCDGTGKIMDGNRTCPDCDGTGERQPEERGSPPLARRRRERHRAVPLLPEVRYFPASGLELRAVEDSDEVVITGAPIVYDTPYTVVDLAGEFEERMSRGVARDVIGRNMDVRFLFNHKDLPMARTVSGTMVLRDSPDALRFTARVNTRQQVANDLVIAIERGDVSQMSCGFIAAKDEWNSSMTKRNVLLFRDLPDISAVTYPCSTSTSIEVARRMALEIPIESRARLRRLYIETRAGAILSASNKGHLIGAVQTLHAVLGAAGVDPSSLIDTPDPTDDQELGDADPDVSTNDDGTEGGAGTSSDALVIGTQVDPGDSAMRARKPVSTLRREVEIRKRRRTGAK